MNRERTYGLELEKPVSKDGLPHGVDNKFFVRLGELARIRGQEPHFHTGDSDPDRILMTTTHDLGDQGLDNGANLLETALPYRHDLQELSALASEDLDTTISALADDGATAINLAIHPLGDTSLKTYEAFVAPKTLYKYLEKRGWDHSSGIDAKAQNSPATGVSAEEAADAVSVIIGSGAAFVGIFGNSPIAEGKITGYKETRLTMWDRMMGNSTVRGDHRTTQFPPDRFRTMAQYFNWMYDDDTGIHFVIADNNHGYKKVGDNMVMIDGNPSVLSYLAMESASGHTLNDVLTGDTGPERALTITPHISHMETMQFAQFAGARIRYGLRHEDFPTEAFLKACQRPNEQKVEEIFSQHSNFIYIEGRDPGANFPDAELMEVGTDVARSTYMAPSAIQAGLINNLGEASAYVDRYDWGQLGQLRMQAIRNGLDGEVDGLSVRKFADDILHIAATGLASQEQELLAYPLHVLRTGMNGADRALQSVGTSPTRETIKQLVISRNVVGI